MKIKLNKSEKEKMLDTFILFLTNKVDTNKYDALLHDKYGDIIVNQNGCLEILNDFYLDEDKYQTFGSLSESDLLKFVEDNYKSFFISNLDINARYDAVKGKNIQYDNLVKNGTLVFMLDCTADFNVVNAKVLTTINKLNDSLAIIEKEFAEKLGIPVRILHREKYIKKNK